jgi:uncharacterized membrane protein YphA (DoxX/SURF4 family)
VIGVVASILVALILIVAAVMKLLEGPLWLKQAADMGVPRPLAQLVPFVELVIGVALLVPALRPWPAIAAAALFVVFTVVVLRRILDGSRPPCACFGARSKRPLGTYHVVRNAVFIALALVAATAS